MKVIRWAIRRYDEKYSRKFMGFVYAVVIFFSRIEIAAALSCASGAFFTAACYFFDFFTGRPVDPNDVFPARFWLTLPATIAWPFFVRLIVRIFKHEGGDFIISSNRYFRYNIVEQAFDIAFDENLAPEKFCQVKTPEHIDEMTRLNVESYRWTKWSDNFEKKYLRNKSHVENNELTSFLIYRNKRKKFFGYTHIIPVTETVWKSYLDGEHEDSKFMGKYIYNPLSLEQPYGLIIFAWGYPPPKTEIRYREQKIQTGKVIIHATAYHISQYCKVQFRHLREVPVLLQNMDVHTHKYFHTEAYNSKTKLSADGVPIIRFNVINPHRNKPMQFVPIFLN